MREQMLDEDPATTGRVPFTYHLKTYESKRKTKITKCSP